ncbi:MAG: hypothetical protein JWR52_1302 [Marmoricola sp.]|nr:hypothetical protein [Marmoricola sp.]
MILLDTHVVLWSLARESRLGRSARRVVSSADVLYISALTHAELAIKGPHINLHLPGNLARLAADAGFVALPFEDRHAAAVNRFPQLERHDPFDRMLVAQADVDRLPLLTANQALLSLEQPWIIDATE